MRARFDDNAREAFQFLMIGAGLVLVGRGLYWAARHLWADHDDALARSAAAFHDGYLLGGNTLVQGGGGIGGRLALAAIIALAVGVTCAIAGGGLARLLRRDPLHMAVSAARGGLLLALLWGVYAALFLPPRSTRVHAEGLVLRERPALLGEIALPWTATETAVGWPDITATGVRSSAAPFQGSGSRKEVVIHTVQADHVVASITPTGSDPAGAQAHAAAEAEALAFVLEGMRIGHRH